jgi:PAS domain S-box-containing protein
MPTLELLWGLLLVVAVLFTLAAGITASLFLHSKKMKESESKFRLLFDRVLAPIILIDEKNRIIDANRATYRLLKYVDRELRNLELRELIIKANWPVLQDELSRCLASGSDFSGETKLITKDRKVVHVEITGTIHPSNDAVNFLVSFRDIGAHKLIEEALREKNAALKEIMAHLEEEKVKLKQQVAETIDQYLMPTLNKLVNDDGTVCNSQYDVLRDSLSQLAASTGGMVHAYRKLTQREIEICNLLKSGASSKDIAESLNISVLTVNKHRERIRKKLILNKTDVNLSTYLREN